MPKQCHGALSTWLNNVHLRQTQQVEKKAKHHVSNRARRTGAAPSNRCARRILEAETPCSVAHRRSQPEYRQGVSEGH